MSTFAEGVGALSESALIVMDWLIRVRFTGRGTLDTDCPLQQSHATAYQQRRKYGAEFHQRTGEDFQAMQREPLLPLRRGVGFAVRTPESHGLTREQPTTGEKKQRHRQ